MKRTGIGPSPKRTLLALSCAVWATAAPGRAFAEEPQAKGKAPPAHEAAAQEASSGFKTASDLYGQGLKARGQDDWAKAVAFFKQAQQAFPHPSFAEALAGAEQHSGHCQEAAEHFGWAAQNIKTDVHKIESLREQATLAQKRTSKLVVKSAGESTDLFVDGERVGRGPTAGPLCVEAGSHVVEAKRASGETARKIVEVPDGGVVTKDLNDFQMHPKPAEAPRVVVERGIPVWKVWTMAGGVVASAVSFGMAVSFNLSANNNSDDVRAGWDEFDVKYPPDTYSGKLCDQIIAKDDCAKQDRKIDVWNQNQTAAGVFYGLGTALLAGTIVLYATTIKREPKDERGWLNIAPAIGSQYKGIEIQARY